MVYSVKYLPFEPEAVSRFKAVAVALLGVVAAAFGIWAVGMFGDYFEANPVYTPISITKALGIDVLGALIPVVVALSSLVIFLKTSKSPIKKLALAFFVSVVLAFLLCHSTPDGLAGYPLMFALGSTLAAVAVNVYPKPFVEMKKSFISSVLLILVCVPLSLFIVDLAYSPGFSGAVIGGNGLTDGLLLSTLYAPAVVVGVFFALLYANQMFLLVESTRGSNKTKSVVKTGAVLS
jgi:hypothetical protein